jgi:hypothetical protein
MTGDRLHGKEIGFWTPTSAENTAAEQGVREPQDLGLLTGAAADLWSSDEEFDEFLASIDRHRHRPRPTME